MYLFLFESFILSFSFVFLFYVCLLQLKNSLVFLSKSEWNVINSLNFCHGKYLSFLDFWRALSPGIIFLFVRVFHLFVVVVFFQHFQFIILLPSGLQGFGWEICWLSCGSSFVCDKLFSLLLSEFSFYLWLLKISLSCVLVWISLSSFYMGYIGPSGSRIPFPSDLKSF